jgi:hypothetical protein
MVDPGNTARRSERVGAGTHRKRANSQAVETACQGLQAMGRIQQAKKARRREPSPDPPPSSPPRRRSESPLFEEQVEEEQRTPEEQVDDDIEEEEEEEEDEDEEDEDEEEELELSYRGTWRALVNSKVDLPCGQAGIWKELYLTKEILNN